MNKKYVVVLSKFAEKQVERLPEYIRNKFRLWVKAVVSIGLLNVRLLPGYHDEPLKGERAGQRSVRLNRSYRIIYCESDVSEVCVVGVVEVNKHEY